MDVIQQIRHHLPGSVRTRELQMLLKAGISKAIRFSPCLQRDGVAIACMEGRELGCKTGCQTCVFVSRGQLVLNVGVLLVYLLVTKPAICLGICCTLAVAHSTGAVSEEEEEAELCLTPATAKVRWDRLTVSRVMCKADSMSGWVGNGSVDNKGVVYSLNACRAESQNRVWAGVTNSMRKSCGDQGKQAPVHGRKEREGGESGMMGRKAQKDTGLLFVLMKIDLGLTHIYKPGNQQKTF